jgi:hypothetical protein
MFVVFAGAGLALAALVATVAFTALGLTLGTQKDLRKINLHPHRTNKIENKYFPFFSDLLDQHEEGGETPTDQDVESAMRILEEENSEEEDEPTMDTVEGPAGLAESQAASNAEIAAAAKAAAAKKLALAIQLATKGSAAAATELPYASKMPEMTSTSRDRHNSSSSSGTSSTNFSKTDSDMPPLY